MILHESVGQGEIRYLVLLQPEPEGGFTVTCPALSGLVSYGAALEGARATAADAIAGYVECLLEDGEPVPPSGVGTEPPLVEELRVLRPT
jgi:predicted RNase H-like HicB family nuclease